MFDVRRTVMSWVLRECERLLEAVDANIQENGLLFETGYGPSGMPHIGTFGEVVRTVMVMNQLKRMRPDILTRLIVFSDDMDGLRKIPDNIPNPQSIVPYLGHPLTSIPDPFGVCESYGAYMNGQLCKFLDGFGFNYEFRSATDCYKSGVYNQSIHKILANYEKVRDLVLPILGEERQKTYHPILPICRKTGKVIIADIVDVDHERNFIVYVNEEGERVGTSALDGNCKMQWKVDWGMRWLTFGVNYEMHGKDLASSAAIASQVCRLLEHEPPMLYQYEMFLDFEGKKISKSKGNGLSVDEWMLYAPLSTLVLYMYNNPHRAKRLSFDVVPKTVDEYLRYNLDFFMKGDKQSNPLWYIHDGEPPNLGDLGVSFGMLIDLACACNPDDPAMLHTFVDRLPTGNITPEGRTMMDELVDKAFAYYNDRVKPYRQYRQPTEQEFIAFNALRNALENCNSTSADELQELVLLAGEKADYSRSSMKPWFTALYKVLFGQESGPRIGTFIAIYGVDRMLRLMEDRIGSHITG